MALQTSGMISLNDIHVEAGGSSGTACTINDSDIRGLIGKSSGAAMDFADWYGASSALDIQTVTVGVLPASLYTPAVYGFYDLGSSSIGSISDGTCNFKGGATYRRMQWVNATGQNLIFALNGTHANSGWTTMNIAGTNFTRASSTYSQLSTTEARWTWATSTNPFGTTAGATKVVTFT